MPLPYMLPAPDPERARSKPLSVIPTAAVGEHPWKRKTSLHLLSKPPPSFLSSAIDKIFPPKELTLVHLWLLFCLRKARSSTYLFQRAAFSLRWTRTTLKPVGISAPPIRSRVLMLL